MPPGNSSSSSKDRQQLVYYLRLAMIIIVLEIKTVMKIMEYIHFLPITVQYSRKFWKSKFQNNSVFLNFPSLSEIQIPVFTTKVKNIAI